MKTFIGGFDPYEHGISFSQLSDWMQCRELSRYRLLKVRPTAPSFALTFGIIIHECLDKVYTAIQKGKLKKVPTKAYVDRMIKEAEKAWRKENPRASGQALEYLEQSLLFAEAVMPIYFEHWKKDLFRMKWEAVERFFKVPFELPNGRTIKFVGKRDGVFRLKKGLWLFETKTSSRVDETALIGRLAFELQVVGYFLSLMEEYGEMPRGVLYNIVRRPGLKLKQKETMPQFAKRCAEDVAKRPEFYFMQYEVSIGKTEIEACREQFLNLIMDFADWCTGERPHYRNTGQCENKYGRCHFLRICSEGPDVPGFTNTEVL